jgi:hypothetical protein
MNLTRKQLHVYGNPPRGIAENVPDGTNLNSYSESIRTRFFSFKFLTPSTHIYLLLLRTIPTEILTSQETRRRKHGQSKDQQCHLATIKSTLHLIPRIWNWSPCRTWRVLQLPPSKIERCHLTPIKLIFPRFFPSYEIEPGADCDARLPPSKIERAASGVAVTSAAGSTFRQPTILAAAAATGLLAAARLWMPDLSPCRWFPSRRWRCGCIDRDEKPM